MYKLWSGQAQYMTILTFIWPLWPWPSTYLIKCFKWHFSFTRATTVQNYFEIHAYMYKLWPGQAQCMTILTFDSCDLYLQPTYKLFQTALLILKGNNCAKFFWNPCINVQVMVRTNPDGCMDTRTFTEQKLLQLCLAYSKAGSTKIA